MDYTPLITEIIFELAQKNNKYAILHMDVNSRRNKFCRMIETIVLRRFQKAVDPLLELKESDSSAEGCSSGESVDSSQS